MLLKRCRSEIPSEEMVVTFGDQLGGTLPARFGNTGETQGSMIFVVENNPAKKRHFLDGIKSQKAEELMLTGWLVELSCGMLILEVVYTP